MSLDIWGLLLLSGIDLLVYLGWLAVALRQPWPLAESLLAAFIGWLCQIIVQQQSVAFIPSYLLHVESFPKNSELLAVLQRPDGGRAVGDRALLRAAAGRRRQPRIPESTGTCSTSCTTLRRRRRLEDLRGEPKTEPISPAWRRIASLLFVASTVAMGLRCFTYLERVPNYLRVLHWLAEWWR